MVLYHYLRLKPSFLGKITTSKTVDQRLGANLKNLFFAKFYSKFATFAFFQLLSTKNAESDFFDQCLGVKIYNNWHLNV